ncbi:MAG: tripartite tricarboxylate transporter permease [Rhodospirillales bacterium]|nr:tripartite tricarboxylate transporter permease [Rhodospirillales bacterium]
MLEGLLSGFVHVADPMNLALILVGTALGIVVGALPGLSSPMAITVLLPVTYPFEPIPALVLLMGVYVGTKLGGSFSAILLRTPGTPAAACTALDGFPMAERGESARALGYATVGSTLGGLISWGIAVTSIPLLATVAVEAKNADIALIGILGLVLVSAFARGSMLKGLIGVMLGLLIATVGLDPIDATDRFTFGVPQMMEGIPFTAALIGFFGIAVVLSDMQLVGRASELIADRVSLKMPSFKELKQRWQAIATGGTYGVFIGAVPGVGAESATWLAYATAKNRSKTPEKFGKGEPDGILTPEACNNATTGGTMIPMLTLGLPGDGSTAVMLGALVLHGIEPGVLLMKQSGDMVYALLAALLIATIFMFLLALGAIKYFVLVLRQDRSFLFPFVLVLASVGAYAISNTLFPVLVALVLGVVGYVLETRRFPLVTVVLGVILGPIIEYNARVAMVISGNDWAVFVGTWPRIILVAITVLLVLREIQKSLQAQKQRREEILTTASYD